MVFSSTLFLFYFLPVFLGVYWLVPARFKNPVALGASLLFYAWGGLNFLALFLGSVVVNFFLIRAMYATPERWKQRIFLIKAFKALYPFTPKDEACVNELVAALKANPEWLARMS